MICRYCNKEYINNKSLVQHEVRCKDNPSRKSYRHHLGKRGGNQFTRSKELGIEYIVSDEIRHKIGELSKDRKHTKETKEKLSRLRKEYLEEHPDKVPFKLNHSSNKSYPEEYFEQLFINENIPLFYHKQIGRYELDFYNDDLKKYVEIDGEQHYLPYMIEHDKERTEYLLALGWRGMRIRWSSFLKMTNEEKKQKIEEIRNFLVH